MFTYALIRISLEAGGNAPFIVFDDANIDEAVEGLSPLSLAHFTEYQLFSLQGPSFANSVVVAKPAFAPTGSMSILPYMLISPPALLTALLNSKSATVLKKESLTAPSYTLVLLKRLKSMLKTR